MRKPLISIIIPAYNEEKHIRNCLKSIVDQDFPAPDYEIILVDNNSTDQTAPIVKNDFPQVRLVKEGKQGVVFARIRGIEEAKGEIIAFTDADSIAPPYWIKNIIAAYQDRQVVAVGAVSNLEPKNSLVELVEPVINKVNPTLKILSGFNLSFRRSAYQKSGGFSSKVNLAEDFFLSLKLKKAGKIIILKNNAVISSSRRYTPKNFFPYAARYLANVVSISLFDKAAFFAFKHSDEENKH